MRNARCSVRCTCQLAFHCGAYLVQRNTPFAAGNRSQTPAHEHKPAAARLRSRTVQNSAPLPTCAPTPHSSSCYSAQCSLHPGRAAGVLHKHIRHKLWGSMWMAPQRLGHTKARLLQRSACQLQHARVSCLQQDCGGQSSCTLQWIKAGGHALHLQWVWSPGQLQLTGPPD